jgi:hypothetical protein
MGDPGSAAGRQRGQDDAGGRVDSAELRDQGHALPRGDQGQHSGEVVGVMPDARRESGGLTSAHRHGVAQRVRTAHDPRRVAVVPDGILGGRGRRSGRGEVDGLLDQRLGVQGGVRPDGHVVVIVDERDVEGPGAQGLGDGGRVELGHHQIQAGVVAAERDQGGREDRTHRGRKRADL